MLGQRILLAQTDALKGAQSHGFGSIPLKKSAPGQTLQKHGNRAQGAFRPRRDAAAIGQAVRKLIWLTRPKNGRSSQSRADRRDETRERKAAHRFRRSSSSKQVP